MYAHATPDSPATKKPAVNLCHPSDVCKSKTTHSQSGHHPSWGECKPRKDQQAPLRCCNIQMTFMACGASPERSCVRQQKAPCLSVTTEAGHNVPHGFRAGSGLQLARPHQAARRYRHCRWSVEGTYSCWEDHGRTCRESFWSSRPDRVLTPMGTWSTWKAAAP